jgi:hypothetical protein
MKVIASRPKIGRATTVSPAAWSRQAGRLLVQTRASRQLSEGAGTARLALSQTWLTEPPTVTVARPMC